jgi:hypothetical protein
LAAILNPDQVPSHVLSIPELDFSRDLFEERLVGPWFRLGARTVSPRRTEKGVEDVIMRQSLLLGRARFSKAFAKLDAVGNTLSHMGTPGGHVGAGGKYSYDAFHRFEFASVMGEPLVFEHRDTAGTRLFVNPDLMLFLELEEKTLGNDIWWDPRRGVEVLVRRVLEQDQGGLETIDIRSDHLAKYLQARQMSLVIGHYRHLHLFAPSASAVGAFVKGDLVVGSRKQGTKAILQNWGLRSDVGRVPFLQRRLHLWFEIKPKEINGEDPWEEEPPFDPYSFTLQTSSGAVAPARWTYLRRREGGAYAGVAGDFMEPVYFRQEVLMKYQGSSGFAILDDGSVRHRGYWGLDRSTHRIGNELLSTYIGDFAEGVPFEEWPHWKQYGVEPPSLEAMHVLTHERTVPDAVNFLAEALERLNVAFSYMAGSLRMGSRGPLWRGSLESLAGRQLKWIYPATADDDEFLRRATLTSTLIIEGLHSESMRDLLAAIGGNLHQGQQKKSLGSRLLLQRVTLVALLIRNFAPEITELPDLVVHAEGKAKHADASDLQSELEGLYKRVRNEFAQLAWLYDLRIHGGVAHAPNKELVATTAVHLGLPKENWHRVDYLRLLEQVAESIRNISQHLESV